MLNKSVGDRIFRTYNIIEYKSPDDYLSINDFYKVYGYTYTAAINLSRMGMAIDDIAKAVGMQVSVVQEWLQKA